MNATAVVRREVQGVGPVVRRCYSDVEARNGDGVLGRGVTNLKRIFGWPEELRLVVAALASTVEGAGAVASADTGAAPLAALVAYHLRLPAVFVRSAPKAHLLSYGGDLASNHPRLSGDRLAAGTPVHLVDDFVHTGQTLGDAVGVLRGAGLVVMSASCILTSPPAGVEATISGLGLRLTALMTTGDI